MPTLQENLTALQAAQVETDREIGETSAEIDKLKAEIATLKQQVIDLGANVPTPELLAAFDAVTAHATGIGARLDALQEHPVVEPPIEGRRR